MQIIFSHVNSHELLDANVCFSSLAACAGIVHLNARAAMAVCWLGVRKVWKRDECLVSSKPWHWKERRKPL